MFSSPILSPSVVFLDVVCDYFFEGEYMKLYILKEIGKERKERVFVLITYQYYDAKSFFQNTQLHHNKITPLDR